MIECADCVNKNNAPSACCHDVSITLRSPTNFKFWSDARWMVAHENVYICKRNSDGEWAVVFETPCGKLTSDGRCEIYETRPQLCVDYSRHTCIVNGPSGPLNELEFHTVEELDEYIREHVLENLREDAKRNFNDARENWRGLKQKIKQAGSRVAESGTLVKTLTTWPFK